MALECAYFNTFDLLQLSLVLPQDVPLQSNSYDCGVFACMVWVESKGITK